MLKTVQVGSYYTGIQGQALNWFESHHFVCLNREKSKDNVSQLWSATRICVRPSCYW